MQIVCAVYQFLYFLTIEGDYWQHVGTLSRALRACAILFMQKSIFIIKI